MVCQVCRNPNPPGARFCNNCGAELQAAPSEGGDRRLVTILFADVVGSTAWAERVDPEEWTEIMNAAMRFMIQAVARYEGTVARLMGDGLLALFGAPVSHEDDAERAVLAALAIRDAAKGYSRRLEPRYGQEFAVRVGINTGLAVLTNVGNETRAEYTAMGDAANLAARFQSVAPPQGIVIGAGTRALVRHAFELRPRGAETVRGREASVSAYEVVAPLRGGAKARGLEGLPSPFVGREEELAALREAAALAAGGRPAIRFVVGEAGLGKSRLLAEFRACEQGLTWLEGRAISYASNAPYHPWREPLIASLRPPRSPPGDATGQPQQEAETLRLLSELHLPPTATPEPGSGGEPAGQPAAPRRRPPWFAALAALMGVEDVENEPSEPREAAGLIAAGVKAHLGLLSRERPVVLVLEDLHWADRASVDLVQNLSQMLEDERLLVVCAMRPDRDSAAWRLLTAAQEGSFEGARVDVGTVTVNALSRDHATSLLDDLLERGSLPAPTRRAILEKVEGNPFYLEEVVRALMDAGRIKREDGRWVASEDVTDVSVPGTLAGVLGARIDRLPEGEKQLVQTASVIGREFATKLLRAVLRQRPGEAQDELGRQLGLLTLEGLLSRVEEAEFADYRFKHEFTRDAAYERLLLKRRRELHGLIGEEMEALFGSHREVAKDLAHHYRLGERWLPAAHWSLEAARSARRLYEPAAALELAETALACLDELAAQGDAAPGGAADLLRVEVLGELMSLGMQLRQHEDPMARPQLIERGERAVELSRQVGDARAQVVSLVNLGNAHVLSGFPHTGFEWLMEAHDLALELGDEKLFLLPLWVATEIMLDDAPQAAAKQLEEVIAMARRTGNHPIEAHARGTRTAALARLGDFEGALAEGPRALAAAEESGSVIKRADVNLLFGLALVEMGRTGTGIEHLTRGTELALSVGGLECACNGLHMLGIGHIREEQFDVAVDELLHAIETATGTSMEGDLHSVRASLASARFRRGDRAAIDAIEREVRNAEAHNDGFGAATARLDLGEALLQVGEGRAAAEHLRRALEWVEERGMWPYVMSANRLLARALDVAGDQQGREAAERRVADAKNQIRWPRSRVGLPALPAAPTSDMDSAPGGA